MSVPSRRRMLPLSTQSAYPLPVVASRQVRGYAAGVRTTAYPHGGVPGLRAGGTHLRVPLRDLVYPQVIGHTIPPAPGGTHLGSTEGPNIWRVMTKIDVRTPIPLTYEIGDAA